MTCARATICIPTFNRADLLDRAITSCRSQTIRELQILVLDDASTDGTAAIGKRHAREDSRVEYVRHVSNLGFIGNWNSGLARAQGDCIKVMGDDDTLEPDAIEVAIGALERWPEVGLVCTDYRTVDGRGAAMCSLDGAYRLYDGDREMTGSAAMADYLLRRIRVGLPTAITFRRSVSERVGPFDSQAGCMADIEYWSRICEVAGFGYVDRVTCTQRRHEQNLSSSLEQDPTYFRDLQRLFVGMVERLDPATRSQVEDRARLLAALTIIRAWRRGRGAPASEVDAAASQVLAPISRRSLRGVGYAARRLLVR